MKVATLEEAINSKVLKRGSVIYMAGNAATPQDFLNQIARDESIQDIEILSVLPLGDIEDAFKPDVCNRVTYRIIFNSEYTREAVNHGLAKYQLMHLSQVARQLKKKIKPDVVMLTVSGPDRGGNYSLGTTVEAVLPTLLDVKERGGIVIAERNSEMPFVQGTTIPPRYIDFLVDTNYDLPTIKRKPPSARERRIGEIITQLYIKDGSTLQLGIGKVTEALKNAVIEKGVKDLGIYTELFADAMRAMVEEGIVTNKYRNTNFSVSGIFLADSWEGYKFLDQNSSIQSRSTDHVNNVLRIATQPNLVSVNAALGVDLHGNIWADSLKARDIYSGVGGQCDYIRGAVLSEDGNGVAIIALNSVTAKDVSKIYNMSPAGITATGIAADPVILVTEFGAVDPEGLSMGEKAVAIAQLAEPETRGKLLKQIYDSPEFHRPREALRGDGCCKGFTPYEMI